MSVSTSDTFSTTDLQVNINLALVQVATLAGRTCKWYRPNGVNNPTAENNLIGTTTALFRLPPTAPFIVPAGFGKAAFVGYFDLAYVQAGDYLIEPTQGPFYVASVDPVSLPLCVRCNHTLTFTRPGATAPGSGYYGGDVSASETPLMAGWPASILTKSRGSMGELRLPGDVRTPWMEILVPATSGVLLDTADTVYDENGNRYTIADNELSAIGWRLLAQAAVA